MEFKRNAMKVEQVFKKVDLNERKTKIICTLG